MSGGRKIVCSSWKDSASRGLWCVSVNGLRERNLLEATEMGFLPTFFEC